MARERSGKAEQDARGETREQPVGGARHRVLLVHHHRHAKQPRRDATGPGHEPAGAEHAGRPQLQHHEQRVHDRHEQQQRRQQLLPAALAAHAAHAQEGNGYAAAGTRRDSIPARVPSQCTRAPRAASRRRREAGHAAGAATGDQDQGSAQA
jgi:hypothetical protein